MNTGIFHNNARRHAITLNNTFCPHTVIFNSANSSQGSITEEMMEEKQSVTQ